MYGDILSRAEYYIVSCRSDGLHHQGDIVRHPYVRPPHPGDTAAAICIRQRRAPQNRRENMLRDFSRECAGMRLTATPSSVPSHVLPFGAIDVFALSGERRARCNLKNVSSSPRRFLFAPDNFERRFSSVPPPPPPPLLPLLMRFLSRRSLHSRATFSR